MNKEEKKKKDGDFIYFLLLGIVTCSLIAGFIGIYLMIKQSI